MTANELFTLARQGELIQLSSILKEDAVLASSANLGIIELYKKFQLKTDEALVTLRFPKTIYSLDGTDPDVAMGEPYMYLIGASGSKIGNSGILEDFMLPINSEESPYTVNTISHNKVQIPRVTTGAVVSLIYVATPEKISPSSLDTEISVPDQFVEALLHYMGYRAHGAMDGNMQAASNTYYAKFEKACEKLQTLGVGIAPDDLDMLNRINSRGFI